MAFRDLSQTIINTMHATSGRFRFAMMTFARDSEDTNLMYNFDTYDSKSQLIDASNFQVSATRTSMEEGLESAQEHFNRNRAARNHEQMIILMTDGAPDITSSSVLRLSRELQSDGVVLNVVGYDRVTRRQTRSLVNGSTSPSASSGRGNSYELVDGAQNKELVADMIVFDMCTD